MCSARRCGCWQLSWRPPAIGTTRASVYTKRKCVTCPAAFFFRAPPRRCKPERFHYLYLCEAAWFPAASVHGWRILMTKEQGYAAAGVCEGNACSVCERANDDGTECASLGDALGATAHSPSGRTAAGAGTAALDARVAGRETAADDAVGAGRCCAYENLLLHPTAACHAAAAVRGADAPAEKRAGSH